MKRDKQPLIVTPAGIAQYPRVNTPDTKFDPDGEYRCNLILDKKDFQHLEKTIQEIADVEYKVHCQEQGKKKLKIHPLPFDVDGEGNHIVKSKRKAVWIDREGNKLENQIAKYDASGQRIPTSDMSIIGGGSRLKMSIRPNFWFVPSLGFGCTLQLHAVQVLEMADYTPNGIDHGFSAEEGYVHGGETFDSQLSEDNEQDEEEEVEEDVLANF
jgi:hypothetical protein|tara:strand:+ start:2458 stop:3096 length:639 start_codon:yes stop_codon:yes gene_type:complete